MNFNKIFFDTALLISIIGLILSCIISGYLRSDNSGDKMIVWDYFVTIFIIYLLVTLLLYYRKVFKQKKNAGYLFYVFGFVSCLLGLLFLIQGFKAYLTKDFNYVQPLQTILSFFVWIFFIISLYSFIKNIKEKTTANTGYSQ
jgi:hypothetical protein